MSDDLHETLDAGGRQGLVEFVGPVVGAVELWESSGCGGCVSSTRYREHLARVLVRRALEEAGSR